MCFQNQLNENKTKKERNFLSDHTERYDYWIFIKSQQFRPWSSIFKPWYLLKWSICKHNIPTKFLIWWWRFWKCNAESHTSISALTQNFIQIWVKTPFNTSHFIPVASKTLGATGVIPWPQTSRDVCKLVRTSGYLKKTQHIPVGKTQFFFF